MRSHVTHVFSKRSVIGMLAASAALAAALPAIAQAPWKPSRNVELVVGSGLGGPLDVTARTLERIFRDRRIIEVPAMVINKPGAGGVLGFNHLNQHQGDGH